MNDQALIALIKGGLGNQLFIYAAAKAAASRTGRRLYLDKKTAYLSDKFGRNYELGSFGVGDMEVPEKLRIAPNLGHWKHKVRRAWNKCLPQSYKSYVADRGNNELLLLCSKVRTIYVNGYWQSERFFSDQTEALRESLKLPEPREREFVEEGARYAATNTVAVHLRRENFPFVVDFDYYQNAITIMHEKIADASFVLFGDSLDAACKELNFHDHPVKCSPAGVTRNPLVDFWLMSQCRNSILSNSSFAWWATWFGDGLRKARTVCAPENYGWRMEPSECWLRLPNRIEIRS